MTCQPAPKVPVSGVTSLVILIALLTPHQQWAEVNRPRRPSSCPS